MGYLDEFLAGSVQKYQESIEDPTKVFMLTGCQQVLIDILQSGQRDDLLSRVDIVWDTFMNLQSSKEYI